MPLPILARAASASALRITKDTRLSSGSVSDSIDFRKMRAGISEITLDIADQVSPFLKKNNAGKLYNQALKYSLRRAVGHFRKQLSEDIGFKIGTTPKKMLKPDQLESFLERMVYLRTQGVDTTAIRKKHMHKDKRPWQSSMKKTITYKKLRKDGMAYAYGFTGRTKSGGTSKTAIQYGKALTEGTYFNSKERTFSNRITPKMKRYLAFIGLATKKDTLDFPKRPVIDPFFRRNRNNMIKYIARRYNQEAIRIQKKADSMKAKRTRIRIA